ncbi:uncharacterized protein LOC132295117 isoform X3 [Cornus florida]|uniref:uncharacterized protein LOC132295117 isoform X3 n=1 Tax=Cornus florida TaxID=4283 RepID=UPI00289C6466|nr:uncharacterized protein LOC132295117 isoform X3 [Cornus florida]
MNGDKEADDDNEQIQRQVRRLEYSITDLPMPIFVDILRRLPVKTIVHCSWYCSYDSDNEGRCYVTCSYQCVKTHHMKLDTKLKIPLRNPEMVLNDEFGDAQRGCSSKRSGVKRKRYIKVKPKEQRFKIVNSCNGFLCDDPLVVCNPITGIKTYSRTTEIQRLGTESWKSIGGGPISSY